MTERIPCCKVTEFDTCKDDVGIDFERVDTHLSMFLSPVAMAAVPDFCVIQMLDIAAGYRKLASIRRDRTIRRCHVATTQID